MQEYIINNTLTRVSAARVGRIFLPVTARIVAVATVVDAILNEPMSDGSVTLPADRCHVHVY